MKYKCHKIVSAKPMNCGDYFCSKGKKIPDGLMPGDEGYLVIYSENTEDHYESWSPKKQFDEGYNIMPTAIEATGIMKYFKYDHLPEHLQSLSKPIGELATLMNSLLPDGAEKSAGLRKLLEAKDCLVRANLK